MLVTPIIIIKIRKQREPRISPLPPLSLPARCSRIYERRMDIKATWRRADALTAIEKCYDGTGGWKMPAAYAVSPDREGSSSYEKNRR